MIQAIAFYEKEAMINSANGKEDSNAIAVKKELQFELSLIQKKVKEKYPQQGTYIEEQLASADSLLNNIPEGTTVVEFFTGEKNIYIVESVKGTVRQIRKLENAEANLKTVSGFVDTYFQHGPGNMMNRPQDYYKDAYHIYQWLWQGNDVKQDEHCIIIPDGILGFLPFDALITDSVYRTNTAEWPFLVKKANLFFSYSLLTLWQQQKTEHQASSFAGFFISFDSSRSSIPSVQKEYEEIHAVVIGDFARDKDATLSAFNKHLEKVNLLHISTHSFLEGKENIPALQLADDKFFLFELYGKTFRPQLVVLSACRTGHGMLAQGEGIISLARGFTTTGAAGIVAGLWDMNDETTALLMGAFYKQLVNGHQPADALHAAKLQWLQQRNGQQFQKLPYFWAGMVYSGDNLPVDISPKNTSTKWWWIAAFVVMGVLILFLKRKLPS
jgi:CHAT domain-containing protein